MISKKPYIIRAFYEWICDNNCTPYIYINTDFKQAIIPKSLKKDNPLVLNISPTATMHLKITNQDITFTTRFSGKTFDVYLPIASILGIVAKETGEGTTFSEETENISSRNEDNIQEEREQSRSKLRLIK